jgi:hypothetical protein
MKAIFSMRRQDETVVPDVDVLAAWPLETGWGVQRAESHSTPLGRHLSGDRGRGERSFSVANVD